MSALPTFRPPTAVERTFNRVFGILVGLGLGFSYNYLLQVKGRKSGKTYSTPIDLLEVDGKRFLVNRYVKPEHVPPLTILLNISADRTSP